MKTRTRMYDAGLNDYQELKDIKQKPYYFKTWDFTGKKWNGIHTYTTILHYLHYTPAITSLRAFILCYWSERKHTVQSTRIGCQEPVLHLVTLVVREEESRRHSLMSSKTNQTQGIPLSDWFGWDTSFDNPLHCQAIRLSTLWASMKRSEEGLEPKSCSSGHHIHRSSSSSVTLLKRMPKHLKIQEKNTKI